MMMRILSLFVLMLTAVGGSWVPDWFCPDGTHPDQFSVHMYFLVDASAFCEDDVYQTYRKELVEFIGPPYPYHPFYVTLILFSNKGGEQTEAVCGTHSGVTSEQLSDGQATMTAAFEKYSSCPTRPLTGIHSSKEYSSLQDAMFHFYKTHHNYNPIDGWGGKKIIFVQVLTDTLPWFGEDDTFFKDMPFGPDSQVDPIPDPSAYCNTTNYPTVNMITEAAKPFDAATTYHFLTKSGDTRSEDLVTYYRDYYMPVVLGGVAGLVDPLPMGGHHLNLTHRRIQEAICGAKFNLHVN